MRGDEATGWGIAWRICLWARLGDGERAWTVLKRQLSPDRTYTNLFDAHPPFQIDGNFGGATGICEMVAQSRNGEIRLLPALPKALATGNVRGMRLRGGIDLDMRWVDGAVTACRILPLHSGALTVRIGDEATMIDVVAGEWSQIVG